MKRIFPHGKNVHAYATSNLKSSSKKANFISTAMLFLLVSALTLNAYVPEATAGSQNIAFSVTAGSVAGTFNVEGSLSDATVSPGGEVDISAGITQKSSSLTLNLGAYGTKSITFNTPLGTISVPVAGVTGASINVDITGSITGSLSKTGPGSLSSSSLSWTNWGTKTVTVDAAQAKDGDTIGVILSLSYTVSVAAKASTLLGTVQLFAVSLGSLRGSSSISANIKVSTAPAIPLLYVGVAVMLFGAVAVGAVVYSRRGKSKPIKTQPKPKLEPMPPATPKIEPLTSTPPEPKMIMEERALTPIAQPKPLVRSSSYSSGDFCYIDKQTLEDPVMQCPFCRALFHEECILALLELKNSCPKCGKPLKG